MKRNTSFGKTRIGSKGHFFEELYIPSMLINLEKIYYDFTMRDKQSRNMEFHMASQIQALRSFDESLNLKN